MTEELQITDLRSLKEKRERLKLEAKYHKLGIEMNLKNGLSISSVLKTVSGKITGNDSSSSKNEPDMLSGISVGAPFGVWGMAIPIVAKAISVKVTTGKSWSEILAHVVRSAMKKVGVV